MRDIQHYYTELHAKGFKYTNKFSGFDSVCAHFSTRAKVGTIAFEEARQEGIKHIGDQETSHGWVDYTVGKTFVKNGSEPVSVMSPAYEYHKGRSFPTYEEVK
jgi:hypothetical protein